MRCQGLVLTIAEFVDDLARVTLTNTLLLWSLQANVIFTGSSSLRFAKEARILLN